MPQPTRTFGANLRRARSAAGLTQQQLATRLGLKRPTPISLWERDGQRPSPRTVERLASALGCAPAELLRNVETPYDAVRRAPARAPSETPLTAADAEWLELGRRLGPLLRRWVKTLAIDALQLVDVARTGADDFLVHGLTPPGADGATPETSRGAARSRPPVAVQVPRSRAARGASTRS